MVLESLPNPFKSEQKPYYLLIYGMVYVFIALFLSLVIFRDYASLVMVFLTVLASTHLMYNIIKVEEQKDLEGSDNEFRLLKHHSKALLCFMMLFFGFVLAFVGSFVMLPADQSASIFNVQLQTIKDINGHINNFDAQANAISPELMFLRILANNMRVLIFCLVFSLFYGVGAIFILTWNASVIGAYVGSFIKGSLTQVSGGFFHTIGIVITGFSKVYLHGVLEILAYFVGGLGGGIISIAIIKHNYRSKNFEKVLFDSTSLIFLAILLLAVAGFVEVFTIH